MSEQGFRRMVSQSAAVEAARQQVPSVHVPEGPFVHVPQEGEAARRADGGPGVGGDPGRGGPVDLRLVPGMLSAWATAAVLPELPWATVPWVVAASVMGAVLTCLVLVLRRQGRPAGGRPWETQAAAVALCAAGAAATTALHLADTHRGPVPELARNHRTATVDVRIAEPPHITAPHVLGARTAPGEVLFEAEAIRIRTRDGAVQRTRAPVLVRVALPEAEDCPAPRGPTGDGATTGPADGADAAGGARAAPTRPPGATVPSRQQPAADCEGRRWTRQLPSTVLRVHARLAPPYRQNEGTAAVIRVRAGAPVVVRAPTDSQRFAGRIRQGLRTATEQLPDDPRSLLPGLVVGDTSRITPELQEVFRATDLTHLLAVSGANFTIVLSLLLGPPGTANRAERRGPAARLGLGLRTTAVLGAGLTGGFLLVCGPEPSVLRAAGCGAVTLVALATGRRRSLLPALAAVALLLVLFLPELARSYGFLLSVLATGALLVVAPSWSEWLRRRGMPPRPAEALAVALAAQAVCAPVVVTLAGRVSLVGVPCNLLAEFAVAPATVLGFGALLTAPVLPAVAEFLAWCASWPVRAVAIVARAGAGLPGSGVDWPGGWTGGLLLAVAVLGAVVIVRRLLRHPVPAVCCALLLLLVVLRPAPLTRVITGWPPAGWRMVACDVGQGDALVLAAGPGAGVVVDAGPDPVAADRCLRELGITRVPLILLTHFHADHVSGLEGVIRGRAVGLVETTWLDEPAGQAAAVRRAAAVRGIPVRVASIGESRRIGALTWEVLWPAPDSPGDGANDASVSLLVRTGGLRLLLLGDLEPLGQQALLHSPAGERIEQVDVLKVAHHGSAHQDPGLIRRARPRVAIVSVGADNGYGHPSPRTLGALEAVGAHVLRTDRDGPLAVIGRKDGALRVATGRAPPGW